MAKFEITLDELKIDAREFAFSAYEDTFKRGMSEALADHGRKYDSGRKPDGTAQKSNSPDYAARKRSPGIRVGGRRQTGSKPTILTGEMKGSRQIRVRGKSVESFFSGRENATKARSLVNKGYGIHYFSEENVRNITERIADESDVKLAKAIRVRKNRG